MLSYRSIITLRQDPMSQPKCFTSLLDNYVPIDFKHKDMYIKESHHLLIVTPVCWGKGQGEHVRAVFGVPTSSIISSLFCLSRLLSMKFI